jgi:hypothetical protein
MPHHLAKMEFLQSGHQLKAQVEQSDDTGERKLAAPWKGPAAQGAARASPAGPMLRLILCLTSVSPCTKRIAWGISLAAMYLHRSRDSHWYQARHCCLYIWSHMICFLAHQRLNVYICIFIHIHLNIHIHLHIHMQLDGLRWFLQYPLTIPGVSSKYWPIWNMFSWLINGISWIKLGETWSVE